MFGVKSNLYLPELSASSIEGGMDKKMISEVVLHK